MGPVRQGLRVLFFPVVGNILQLRLVPWLCYVFSGSATINQLHLQQPLLSQRVSCEGLKPRTSAVNGVPACQGFHVTRDFFFSFSSPPCNEKRLGSGHSRVLVGKCRQEPMQSWAGWGSCMQEHWVPALRH